MTMRVGLVMAAAAAISVGGCSAEFHEFGAGHVEQSRNMMWTRPVNGRYLCLSADPGTPVYSGAGGGAVIGYTRDVVGFFGGQQGNWLQVFHYNGLLGWVDSAKLHVFHGSHPGASCIIPGVDTLQRPIFVIQ